MKVLNLSLDNKVLDKNSEVAQRAIAYGDLLDQYLVVVPGENKKVELSSKTKVVGIKASNKFFTFFDIYRFIYQELSNKKYDLITIQDSYYLAFLGISLAKKFGLKIELQVHGFEKLSILRRYVASQNINKADKIRTVSQRLKNKIIKEFDISEDKIYIAPVAIDKYKFRDSEANINLKEQYPNDFVFLTISRLVAVKNISLQIKALAKLENKNVKLIIAGDGPEKANLQNLARELKIEDKIIFAGWIDNLSGYYKSADCLLLSSNSEGYGMIVAEAVLVGLPVIMTDVGVAGELVEDNSNGLIVPINNQELFAQAMSKVVEDKELLQKFSVNSKLFTNKILNKQELINKVVDNWKTIL
jgi:glycosyltransferase involved in cell wall biosynthesis